MKHFLRYTIAPLFLMISTPLFAFLFWFTATTLDGAITSLIHFFATKGLFNGFYLILSPVFFGSKFSWSVIGVFSAIEILLMKIVPGKTYFGPTTAMGNRPVYKENGFACFLITLALFLAASIYIPSFNPALFYTRMGEFIGALNLFSLAFCAFLYLKGRYFPSSSDHGVSKNLIFDFYWGTELYPRIFGIDLKQWTNCRFGMMSWPLIILSFIYYQNQTSGVQLGLIVSVALQLLYVAKFFIWEKGYMRSIDIMHDRAGYYICWGCLVWVPVVYTSPALYIANLPETLNYITAFLIFAVGAAAILANFWCDYQRMIYREEYQKTKKLLSVGYIEAISKEGGDRGNKYPLITTGLWGISRNFRYVLELLGAFFWTLPAAFFLPLPWFYFLFLTILLVDRANRNDLRCHRRYKEDWGLYCKEVPYKMLPWIY